MVKADRFETPFFLGLLIFAAGLVLFIFLPELSVVVLAITLAVLFFPVYNKLKTMMPRWQGLAAFLTLILAVIIILAPLTFFGVKIFQEAQGLYSHLVSGGAAPFLQFVNLKLGKVTGPLGINLNQSITQSLGGLVSNLGAILSQLAGVVWVFFLALFAFYYLLRDGEQLKRSILKVTPLPEKHTHEILEKLQAMASSVVRGSLLVAVAYGILIGIGFVIFGLPNAILWGAASVIAALIPVVGTLFIAVPAVAALLFMGHTIDAIGFVIWLFLIAVLMENFLRPKLIGQNAKVHPLLLLFSVIGGLELFGAMGILLGPLALSLLLTLFEMYPQLALERRASNKR